MKSIQKKKHITASINSTQNCFMLLCVFIQASVSPYITLRFPAASHGLHEYESRVKLKICCGWRTWWRFAGQREMAATCQNLSLLISRAALQAHDKKKKKSCFFNSTFALTFCAYSLEIENHDLTPLPQHWDNDQVFDLNNPRHFVS